MHRLFFVHKKYRKRKEVVLVAKNNKPKDGKLTPKQKAFADFYIKTANASQSALMAGYSPRSAALIGQENMAKPHIKAYIEKRMEKADRERVASADEVLAYLTRVIRGEEEEETVVVEGQGDGVSTANVVKKRVTPKDKLKAAELLGKRYKLFTEKVEAETNVGIKIVDDV